MYLQSKVWGRKLEEKWRKEKLQPKPSLMKCVVQLVFGPMMVCFFIRALEIAARYTVAYALQYVVAFFSDPSVPLSSGVFAIGGLTVCALVELFGEVSLDCVYCFGKLLNLSVFPLLPANVSLETCTE